MVETNTTNLSLFNDSLYDEAHGRDNRSCESQTSTVDFFALFWWGVWLCGMLGNVMVVWFLGFHMKKSPFTVYALNLAIADFSLIFFFLFTIRVHSAKGFFCLNFPDVIFTVVYLLFLFCYLSSMYLLTATSVERCVSVLFPIWYRCHRHNHLSGIVCGVLWALPGLFICFTSICCNFYLMSVCGNIFRGADLLSSLIFSTLSLLSNLILFIKLQCCSPRCPPGRLYIALFLTSLFFIFAVPLSVEQVLEDLFIEYRGLSSFFLLADAKSSINPLIYFLVGSYQQHRFQGSVKAALHRVFEEKMACKEGSRLPGEVAAEMAV
ncbi:LOW QUALITY PROTEIN: mas-related G-protein coupled receptor member X1-like [Calonectris borealis]|uniref:LOW QUALITY PROTEIN: mas-related G-protein coupled receptor member X1-like n=1 Tax=Calonectris borealis TaxID=1323832 RepID=UPI003F4C1BF3